MAVQQRHEASHAGNGHSMHSNGEHHAVELGPQCAFSSADTCKGVAAHDSPHAAAGACDTLQGHAMSAPPAATAVPDPDLEQKRRRQVIAASIVGNLLEWYDFLVYAYQSVVISKLFFPNSDTYTRYLSVYGIFAAGFITRPLGALFFGWIGDRFSRKTALLASIYTMSAPTFLVGCLPTYAQVGRVAPWLLVLTRIVQGFAVGGEFTATMVFLVEHAPPGQAGLQGSWAFFSVMVGVLCGSGVSMLFNYALDDEQLYTWGWRVPFLISIFGAAVGAYMRRHVHEPPEEKKEAAAQAATTAGTEGADDASSQGQQPLLHPHVHLDHSHNHNHHHSLGHDHTNDGLGDEDEAAAPLEVPLTLMHVGSGSCGFDTLASAAAGSAADGRGGLDRSSGGGGFDGESERLLPDASYSSTQLLDRTADGQYGRYGGLVLESSTLGHNPVASTSSPAAASSLLGRAWAWPMGIVHGMLARPAQRALLGGVTVFTIDFLTAVGFYLTVIFLPTYFQEFSGLSRRQAMSIHTSNMVLYMLLTPVGGLLLDRFGSLPLVLLPGLAMAALAYPLWALLSMHGSVLAALEGQAGLCVIMALFNGSLPATFVSLFHARHRCTGLSVGHNLSMAICGGTAPLIATALMKRTGSNMAPAFMLVVAGLFTALGAGMARSLFGTK